MPEDDDTVSAAGTLVWENRKGILKALGKIATWFRGKKHGKAKNDVLEVPQKGILILGCGGTGKTTVARLLAGEFDSALNIPGPYKESLQTESFKLKGSTIEVVVPPGQEFRRDATWTDLCKDVEAGKFRGIILVSAFGFHSLSGISYTEHALFASHKAKPQFLKAYLHKQRNEEIDVLRKLASHIQKNRHPMWLLSIIAKQDLWIPETQAIRKHYSDPTEGYVAVAHSLLAHKDALQFRHELVFASLTMSNFESGVGEVLRKTASGYDQRKHVESLRNLFEAVNALKNWELR